MFCFDSKKRNNMNKVILRWTLTIFFAAGVFMLRDALAIDENYSSPYGSQWDMQSQPISLPLETLFGAFLLVLNLLAAAMISVRSRKRQRS